VLFGCTKPKKVYQLVKKRGTGLKCSLLSGHEEASIYFEGAIISTSIGRKSALFILDIGWRKYRDSIRY